MFYIIVVERNSNKATKLRRFSLTTTRGCESVARYSREVRKSLKGFSSVSLYESLVCVSRSVLLCLDYLYLTLLNGMAPRKGARKVSTTDLVSRNPLIRKVKTANHYGVIIR